jgi:hypothetical protein
MWELALTTTWEKDEKYYSKRHPKELAAIFRNVQRYRGLLKASPNSKAVQAGYLHHEPGGVVALDQKGGGANLQETRGYTYADDEKKILYLITIGNKSSQRSDIELSKNFVRDLQTSSPANGIEND